MKDIGSSRLSAQHRPERVRPAAAAAARSAGAPCGRVRPGLDYGQSDFRAALPARDPVTPEDLAATLFAAMNLDPHATVYTPDNRPMPASHGRPIKAILG